MTDWDSIADDLGSRARRAGLELTRTSAEQRRLLLHRCADGVREARSEIVAANQADLAGSSGLAASLVHRLKLDAQKVSDLAMAIEKIADQPDPVGQILESRVRPDGLRIERKRVPLGAILFFYESRPNVTGDAAALCIKSGNAVILRGGKEAARSNAAICAVFKAALDRAGMNPDTVQLVDTADRAIVRPLLKLDRYLDLVIPRGGESLIRAVVADSTIPVLKHYTGNCHIYIDTATTGIEQKVRDICVNAKTGYPGGAACNVAEKLLFHRGAVKLLPVVLSDLVERGVEIRGDEATCKLFPLAIPANESDWPLEYLSMTIAVKIVDTIDAAIDHINRYSSRHTDAILSTDPAAIKKFIDQVDSSSVMVNASTRFADGGEYGLGAEIGISTDKLHARGPMGAADLTTYKWVITGDGHVRT